MSRLNDARPAGGVADARTAGGTAGGTPARRWPRRTVIAALAVCGVVLLYSLPVITIPLIDTPQVSFASVLFYPIGIYVLLAVGLDMTVGRSGQLNLGYAAFFAAGAYTTGVLSTDLSWSYYATIVPAIIVSMLLGLAVGIVSLRVSGDYFAIVTLGIGLVVQEIIANVGVLGTTLGISSIPPPDPLLGLTFSSLNLKAYDWLLFTLIIVVCVVFALIYRSSLGRAWAAIRDDEGAAELMGVRTRRLKVLASTIGAAPAGLAGSIYAAQVGYISPETFGLTLSILVLAAVTLGGKGRIAGVIIGGVLVGYLPERFLAVDRIHTLLFGAVIVVVMLFRPEGILGSIVRRRRAAPTRSSARPGPSATPGDAQVPAKVVHRGGDQAVPEPSDAIDAAPAASHPVVSDRPETSPQSILTVEHLRVAFGGVIALDEVSVSAVPGAVTSVIGPNGAGKTTLINSVTGVYHPASGRIRIGDRDVTHTAVAQRSRLGLARTFQNIRLFGGMTALENVLVAAEARRRGSPRAVEGRSAHGGGLTDTALALLDYVGLSDVASTRSDQLPYGAQRRLEIARALALDPKVVLLDEPAAGANTAEKRELTDLIRQIADGGRSVLLIEHDMRLVMEISTKVVVLNFGKVIAEGPPGEIQRDPGVIAAYLGESSHV
jgi:branched-chain amino acid transport system permease protein